MHNFFISGLIPIVVFVLQLFDSTKEVGKAFFWICKIVPTYNLCSGIVTISNKDLLATINNKTNPSVWDMDSAGGDCVFMAIHSVVWLLVIALIENGVFKMCAFGGRKVTDEIEEWDSDVKKEHERVEAFNDEDKKGLAVHA